MVELPAQGQTITLIAPSSVEIAERELELAEKKRVAELVKKMNQNLKKEQAKAKPGQGKTNKGVPRPTARRMTRPKNQPSASQVSSNVARVHPAQELP